MSKKQAKSTIEIYQGLGSTVNRANVCLVEDINGNYSLHNSKQALEQLQSFSALIKDTLSKVWGGFNEFLKEHKNTVLAYHEQLFKTEPPKDQPIEVTAVYVWNKLISIAKTDLTTEVPVSASGRKSTIGTCEYRLGEQKVPNLKTPQAQACYRLLTQCIAENAGTYPAEDPFITEQVLKQYIIDHAAELKTRQDPWRIFQYYRPVLITDKLITRK